MKNNANNETKKLTLGQLKAMLPSTRGKSIPRPDDLRKEEQVVVKTQVGGCEMTVFTNGFAIYQNEYHYTILRMEHVGKAHYYSEVDDEAVDVMVEDEDWTIGVMVSGEDRIEDRYQIKAQQRLTSMYTVSDDGEWEEREFDSGEDFVEEYIAKLEREAAKVAVDKMLSCLTERQREIFLLHHLQGLSMREIGEKLDIDFTTVYESIKASVRKIKKIFEFFQKDPHKTGFPSL